MIDVNGTRYHLLFGEGDWEPLRRQSPDLAWNAADATFSLRAMPFRFPIPPGDQLPRPESRRGAAQDMYGNWYWIDDGETHIRVLSSGSGTVSDFWPVDQPACDRTASPLGAFGPVSEPSEPAPAQLRGLTVTGHHYLVAGVLEPDPGLLIFDLHAGGSPTQWLWPDTIDFRPFDMAPAPNGGLWILERAPAPRYWGLDRNFRVITQDQFLETLDPPRPEDFGPQDGQPRLRPGRSFPTGLSLELASPVDAGDAVAIEGLSDGTVIILDSDPTQPFSQLRRYRLAEQVGATLSLQPFAGDVGAEDSGLRGHDIAVVLAGGGPGVGTLFLADAGGNQSYAFALTWDEHSWGLALQPRYYPMRLFSGKAIVAAGQRAYYDMGERWLPLAEQPQRRYARTASATAPRSAASLPPDDACCFDGKEPDCVWHRVFLDACIPPDTQVVIESRAANQPELVTQLPWALEPAPYLRHRGSELPYHQPFADKQTLRAGTGTWELLLQHARGRYLQLRLTLSGTGRTSPRLRALRVYYPRFSYLAEYLPAVYRQDAASASFLDRFLANLEGMYTVLEGRIAQAQLLFSPHTAPAEYLDWLAGWFGAMLDEGWDESRRRLFLRHAITLFNQRGTISGLIRAVRLSLDPCPDDGLFLEPVIENEAARFVFSVRVVEHFLIRQAAGVQFGDPSDLGDTSLFAEAAQWTPSQGAAPLHAAFRSYLEEVYRGAEGTLDSVALAAVWGTPSLAAIQLPPVLPAAEAQAADWLRFTQSRRLGFAYAPVTADDAAHYRRFLLRRYRRIGEVNRAYQLAAGAEYGSFADIQLPATMPAGGVRLADWIQFVSLALPIRRNAHRFTVLIPTLSSDASTRDQIEHVRRIVAREKPAHTAFDVKPYWALFRVGEARTGLDTLLGQGSRFTALMVGGSYLAEGYLGADHPANVADRMVLGRTGLGQHGPL